MASCTDTGKSSWPELVGINGEVALAIIERQNPNIRASVVEEGAMVTADFRCDRVRVSVDGFGIVKVAPKIDTGKSSWPELVGINGEVALAIIERQNLNIRASVVKEGAMVTADFRCDRVRVSVDGLGIVKVAPKIG